MCDTWVALRDATAGGNVILGKNSDRPIFDCQPLLFYPRQQWPAGSHVDLAYLRLPQVRETFATLGSSPYWCWGYEEGINEHGVVIGNEAIFTKSYRTAAEAYRAGQAAPLGLLGMEVVRLALERSRTAAEAVEVIGVLVEQYGQFGSGVPGRDHAEGSYDGSFIVADPGEAWVVEAVGRRWAARRFSQGFTSISNEPTIRTSWERGSADLIAHALEQGWWPEDQADRFDFARAYSDERRSRQVSHLRLMRSHQLLDERAGQITPAWMKRIARDHYEGSFLRGPSFDAADPDFQTICMHASPANFTWGNTASSCVAVLPKEEGEMAVFWWTPGPPCNGCYVPFFVHGSKLPPIVTRAGTVGRQVVAAPVASEDRFSADSYWWLFRRLLDVVKGDPVASVPGYYPERNRLVRSRFDALEADFAAELAELLSHCTVRPPMADEEQARRLDDFSSRCVERVVAAVNDLLNELDDAT
jgi:secernin